MERFDKNKAIPPENVWVEVWTGKEVVEGQVFHYLTGQVVVRGRSRIFFIDGSFHYSPFEIQLNHLTFNNYWRILQSNKIEEIGTGTLKQL